MFLFGSFTYSLLHPSLSDGMTRTSCYHQHTQTYEKKYLQKLRSGTTRLGRSKEPKPMVMWGPERVLLWRPVFMSISITYIVLCHNYPTHLSHKCPTHLNHKQPILISHYVLTSHFVYVWKCSHNEYQYASWCWCSPTRHTTSKYISSSFRFTGDIVGSPKRMMTASTLHRRLQTTSSGWSFW